MSEPAEVSVASGAGAPEPVRAEERPKDLFMDLGQAADDVTNTVSVLPTQCISCEEMGITNVMMTRIPFFRDIIIMAFECEHCGFRNSEVQSAEVQEKGCTFTLRCTHPKVRAHWAGQGVVRVASSHAPSFFPYRAMRRAPHLVLGAPGQAPRSARGVPTVYARARLRLRRVAHSAPHAAGPEPPSDQGQQLHGARA